LFCSSSQIGTGVGNCGVDRWEIRLTVSQSVYLAVWQMAIALVGRNRPGEVENLEWGWWCKWCKWWWTDRQRNYPVTGMKRVCSREPMSFVRQPALFVRNVKMWNCGKVEMWKSAAAVNRNSQIMAAVIGGSDQIACARIKAEM